MHDEADGPTGEVDKAFTRPNAECSTQREVVALCNPVNKGVIGGAPDLTALKVAQSRVQLPVFGLLGYAYKDDASNISTARSRNLAVRGVRRDMP